MQLFAGFLAAFFGLFGLFWYRVLVRLPAKRKPQFIRHPVFRWGVPPVVLAAYLAGTYFILLHNLTVFIILIVLTLALGYLLLRFDRESAEIRVIYDRYSKIKSANPTMEEFEVQYHTAEWRYPKWPQDRLVELVAGKDIGGLILLMMIQENEINPLTDWDLYRSLKQRVARVVQAGS